MKIYKRFPPEGRITRPVVTIGSYDGVHRGHREIITRLRDVAAERRGESVVITFEPHPRQVLSPGEPLHLLNTPAEKEALLASVGLDKLIVLPFTVAFSQIPAETFVRDYLVGKLRIDTLIVGYNHHLGHAKSGNVGLLDTLSRELGFHLEEMPAQNVDENKVSSTVVRDLIAEGKMREAERYLGAPYPLSGTLRNGEITTVDPAKLLPCPGRYPVLAAAGGMAIRKHLLVGPGRSLKLEEGHPAPDNSPVSLKFF